MSRVTTRSMSRRKAAEPTSAFAALNAPTTILSFAQTLVSVLPANLQLLLCIIAVKMVVDYRRGACEDLTPIIGVVRTILKQTIWHTNCTNAVEFEYYVYCAAVMLVLNLIYNEFRK